MGIRFGRLNVLKRLMQVIGKVGGYDFTVIF